MIRRAQRRTFAVLTAFAITIGGGAAQAQVPTVDLGGSGAEQIWQGLTAGAEVGRSLDKGDLRGDGNRRDLIVGSPGWSSDTGQVYIIFGGPKESGLTTFSRANAFISGAATGDRFGSATAAGHVTQIEDRFIPRDLVVGAPGASGNRGAVYLFTGGFPSGQTINASSAAVRILGAPNDRLGSALATADLNGDGYREIVAGAPGNDRVYVIAGGPSMPAQIDLGAGVPAGSYLIEGQGHGIGSVLAARDFTGSGVFYSVAIGAPQSGGNTGIVFVVHGRPGGLGPSPVVTVGAVANAIFTGIDPGDRAGTSLGGNDLDGDNVADLIVGAPGGDGPGNTRADAGEAYIIYGGPGLNGLQSLAAASVTVFGEAAGHRAGHRVSPGDLSRDGINDLVLLAPGAGGGKGEVQVVYGRSRSQFGSALDLGTAMNRRVLADSSSGPIEEIIAFEVTGEGSVDIAAAVPSGNAAPGSKAGRVYFTLSPRLRVSTRTLTTSAQQGGAVSSAITISNPSHIPVTWTVVSRSPWITVTPSTGASESRLSGVVEVTTSAAGLPAGPLTGSFQVISTAVDLKMTIDVSVNFTVTPGPGGGPPPSTLPQSWRDQFGLTPGNDGPNDDPDGDGLTNAEEYQAGTHRRGFHTRYFAEGASSPMFQTQVALLNTDSHLARVLLRYLPLCSPLERSSGSPRCAPQSTFTPVPGRARRTASPGAVMHDISYATVVESDRPIVADRRMTWDGRGYGSHSESSLNAPQRRWYLAEGATHSGFQLFYLLQNPSLTTDATVTVTFLLPAPQAPLTKQYIVRADSRENIWVNLVDLNNDGVSDFPQTDVSAVIDSDIPILVERAMYLQNDPARFFNAGHVAAAVPAASTDWFLAEGTTCCGFETFVLVANPNATAARVTMRFLRPSGAPIEKTYTVAANSRYTVRVSNEHPALADEAISTVVSSTVPVIVERAVWWPGSSPASWFEAHASAGATATGTRWALADGAQGIEGNTETYVLVANTSPYADDVKVTLIFEAGEISKTVRMAANSRLTVDMLGRGNSGLGFPEAVGRRFGVLVESLGQGSSQPAQLVVERAMYSDSQGLRWAAGTNSLGTRLQ